jgi:hypothetical protein
MGKIYLEPDLNEEIENKFREKANKRYKFKKGALTYTIIDLIEAFVNDEIELPDAIKK